MAKFTVNPEGAPVAELEVGSATGHDWARRREALRGWLSQQPLPDIGSDEIEAHFAGMPAHYWESVTESDLVWGLQTIHRFLASVVNSPSPPTMPILDWRHLPSGDGTRVILCTWDRRGLLAKAAACFSAVKLSIEQAAIFTRADQIVLDVLRVYDVDQKGCAVPARMEQMSFLLDGALSEPPRFASIWACSRHKFLAPPGTVAPRITFDNDASPASTLVHIQANDRLGLLYDTLNALAELGLNVLQAHVETQGQTARDVLHFVDNKGRKILEPDRLHEIRRALEIALTLSE